MRPKGNLPVRATGFNWGCILGGGNDSICLKT